MRVRTWLREAGLFEDQPTPRGIARHWACPSRNFCSCQSSFHVTGGSFLADSAYKAQSQQNLSQELNLDPRGRRWGPRVWTEERKLESMSIDQEVSQRRGRSRAGRSGSRPGQLDTCPWTHVPSCMWSRTEP